MSWSPPGRYLWDTWFVRRDGALHAFYLQAEVEACGGDPERRHDLASIGHAVQSPEGWREVGSGPALRASPEPAWDDLALWTGSIVPATPWAPYALFYTARQRGDAPVDTPHERQRPQQIGLAFSDDLLEWRRFAWGPVILNPGASAGLDGVAWRDPYVMREGNFFHAFICARLAPALTTPDAGGAVVHVMGRSPEAWDAPRLFVGSEHFYQMEVPQVFWRRQGSRRRLYLLFSAQERDCSAARGRDLPEDECRTGTYWMASETVALDSAGFPTLREPARLLAGGLYAGKLLDPEEAEAPLLLGFPWPEAGQAFAGGIAEPRSVRFGPDGQLQVLALEAMTWPR